VPELVELGRHDEHEGAEGRLVHRGEKDPEGENRDQVPVEPSVDAAGRPAEQRVLLLLLPDLDERRDSSIQRTTT